MAEEAIIRIIVTDEAGPASGGIPPEPSGGGSSPSPVDAESSATLLVASARSMRLSVDTLTADISRASVTLRSLALQPKASVAPSASIPTPKAITYQPTSAPAPLAQPNASTPIAVPPVPQRTTAGAIPLTTTYTQPAPVIARTPYDKLKDLHKRGNVQPEEVEAIIQSAGLTKREREAYDLLVTQSMPQAEAATQMGVSASRPGALAAQVKAKMGLPVSIADTQKNLEVESRHEFDAEGFWGASEAERAASGIDARHGVDQVKQGRGVKQGRSGFSADVPVDFSREPSTKHRVSRADAEAYRAESQRDKLTTEWMKESGKKAPDQAKLDILLAKLNAPHLAEGGLVTENLQSKLDKDPFWLGIQHGSEGASPELTHDSYTEGYTRGRKHNDGVGGKHPYTLPLHKPGDADIHFAEGGEIGGGSPPQSSFVVVNRGLDGKLYYGTRGDMHVDVLDRFSHKNFADENSAYGFAGPDGKFLTREEAFIAVEKATGTTPDSSLGLRAGRLDSNALYMHDEGEHHAEGGEVSLFRGMKKPFQTYSPIAQKREQELLHQVESYTAENGYTGISQQPWYKELTDLGYASRNQFFTDNEEDATKYGSHVYKLDIPKDALGKFSAAGTTKGQGFGYGIDAASLFDLLSTDTAKIGKKGYHFDEGGEATDAVPNYIYENEKAPNEERKHWPTSSGIFQEGGEDWPAGPWNTPHHAEGGESIAWNKYYGGSYGRQRPYLDPTEGRAVALGDPELGLYIRRSIKDREVFNLWHKRHNIMSAKSAEALQEAAPEANIFPDPIFASGTEHEGQSAKEVLKDAGYNVAKFADKQSIVDLWEHVFSEALPEHHAAGGRIDMSRGGSMPNTGVAKSGADWHPAWLTDKEVVINAKSSERNRNALLTANANPDVRLKAEHFAGGGIPQAARMASRVFDTPYWTGTPGTPGTPGGPPPGGVGPPSPGTVGTPGTPGAAPGLASAAAMLGGPEAQLAIMAVQAIVEVQHAQYEAVVKATASVGEFARTMADPDANPAKLFFSAGDLITSGGEKASKALNMAINPLGAMLGLDLFPPLKLLSGVAGEAAKQFGALMIAIDGTAQKYGEYSAVIAAAQAQNEVKQTFGDLRRAQEAGPELAQYLHMQGDLQQKWEDIKIKVLMKILPIVTLIGTVVEKAMAAGEPIVDALATIASPLTALVAVANQILGIQADASARPVGDPTDIIFQDPIPGGGRPGPGIGVPNR